MTLEESVARIQERFGDRILRTVAFRGEQTMLIAKKDIRDVLGFCREVMDYNCLLDVSSVDNLGEEPRFEIVYELYSFADAIHLRVKAGVSEDDLSVDTVSDLWPTADWHEREVYDMMGIGFRGHPDLRRILMWEGYPYYPLRKDFPLAGKPSSVPDVAFSGAAPLAGGPFVTAPGAPDTVAREPRSREAD